MQTGIRFIKDWSDEEFPRLGIIVADQQVTLVTEVFGGATEVLRIAEQMALFKQQVANNRCTLNFDKFYQEFAYGSLLLTLDGVTDTAITLHVAIRSSSASSWHGHAMMKMQTNATALESFIRALHKLAGKGNHSALLACQT